MVPYALRQSYNDNMVKALLITPLLTLALFGTPIAINNIIKSLLPTVFIETPIFPDLPQESIITQVFVIPEKPKPSPAATEP